MNPTFDYRGVHVAPSRPVAKLRTITKTVYIDSIDRDETKYVRNGDFVVYLPRVYENVVCLRLKGAEFPDVGDVESYDKVTNTSSALGAVPLYFFLDVEGLGRADETVIGGDRSTFTDSVFAKIQVPETGRILYSEDNGPKNINYYQPPIARLDRLHIRARLHGQTSNQSIHWPDEDYALSLDIVTIENSFDDASGIETRLGERGFNGFGC
jgi:hypothetical protein